MSGEDASTPHSGRDGYAGAVLARLTDFFSEEAIQWPRRLWDVGSLLALQELWEAGSWESLNVLSPAATDWQRGQLQKVIGPDIGLGERELRSELTSVLRDRTRDPSPARRRLKQIIEHARVGYLDRWEAAVRADEKPKVERLSRTVAAHLLDLGYTAGFLSDWVRGLRSDGVTADEIVGSAADLARWDPQYYEVLVPLVGIPQREKLAAPLDSWRSKTAVIEWLHEHDYSTAGVRVGGGFVYRFSARDPHGAASQARAMVDRLVARSTFLRRNRDGVTPMGQVWVAGHSEPIPLATPARGADVLSLVHEEHMYRVDGRRSKIDDALELAAPINRGALGPAVAGGWAAVESLLTHPDDPQAEERSGKAVAADRLAAIITCSWPRAELTSLAHHHSPGTDDDEIAAQLQQCATNRERARVIADALRGGAALDFRAYRNLGSEQAAADRMRDLLKSPQRTLRDVRDAFTVAIRRLYRARNIVLHGGSTQGVALEASLRTAAPLLGAGLDRIVHAALAEGIEPLDLAARADVSLGLVGGETELSVVDLLEQPRSP